MLGEGPGQEESGCLLQELRAFSVQRCLSGVFVASFLCQGYILQKGRYKWGKRGATLFSKTHNISRDKKGFCLPTIAMTPKSHNLLETFLLKDPYTSSDLAIHWQSKNNTNGKDKNTI